jgi:small subunit ribosomal protein S21
MSFGATPSVVHPLCNSGSHRRIDGHVGHKRGAESRMAIRIKSKGNESAEQMVRRFKKLCEKEGLTKDLKKRAFYEKPSERRRRTQRKPRVVKR